MVEWPDRGGLMDGSHRNVSGDPPPPDDVRTDPLQHKVYGGRYAVEGELGRGGMGRVLRARDRKIGRAVALKVLEPGMRRDRFEQEARAAGALNHPNIPRARRRAPPLARTRSSSAASRSPPASG